MNLSRRSKKENVRWVALANPNNPTGTQIPKAALKAILLAAPDTVVLVDEAYQDFSGQTILPWIRKYPNLIVTRTFSKAFGLGGAAHGLPLCQPRLDRPLAARAESLCGKFPRPDVRLHRHPLRRPGAQIRGDGSRQSRRLSAAG